MVFPSTSPWFLHFIQEDSALFSVALRVKKLATSPWFLHFIQEDSALFSGALRVKKIPYARPLIFPSSANL